MITTLTYSVKTEWFSLFLNSSQGKKILIILSLLLLGYILYLLIMQARICARKNSLKDYATFVVKTYGDDEIPRLIMRYYLREIESYNRLRQKFPFRKFWKELDADKTLNLLKKDMLAEQKKAQDNDSGNTWSDS